MRKFSKEFMQAIVWDDNNEVEVIEVDIVDNSRWETHHEVVFRCKDDDKYYTSAYSKAATECQDSEPYEYDGDEIECTEVEMYYKSVKAWRGVER